MELVGTQTPRESDWRWQARNSVTTLEALQAAIALTAEERAGVQHALADGFPMAITRYYLGLCDPADPACPIRLQSIPRAAEANIVEGDLRDPLAEDRHEVAPCLVQRYPDRVLLLVTDRCAVYCRFCTRSRIVGSGTGARSLASLEPAFQWIEAHREVHDVIVSGGDPGLLGEDRIAAILARIATISHVTCVRFATRVPVTLPMRVTDAFCAALRSHPATWVMTHFNHPRELTREARTACARLADAGLPVMNQTVLLRGVNDNASTLEHLFRSLVSTRVRPYYLLQADPVRGTAHVRTPLARGAELMAELQGRVSGIALPKFVVDTPGGRGKVVLAGEPIVARAEGRTTLRTFRGELVDYVDPPVDEAHRSRR